MPKPIIHSGKLHLPQATIDAICRGDDRMSEQLAFWQRMSDKGEDVDNILGQLQSIAPRIAQWRKEHCGQSVEALTKRQANGESP